MKIPEWQYPLYKDIDKENYIFLEWIGKSKKYPKIIGEKNEINSLLRLIIASQKMKDYRKFRIILMDELKKEEINIPDVLDRSNELKIIKGVDESWAIFFQDKRICELIDEFNDSDIEFIGNKNQVLEFIVRFFLSQLLQDWRGPLMAVIITCLQDKKVEISKLNDLLKIWDYTGIFADK